MKIVLWISVGIGAVILLYLIGRLFDRFCIYLENRGLLFYKHKQSSSSASSAMVGLQKFVEPGTRHVVEAQQNLIVKEDAAGNPAEPGKASDDSS